MVTEYLIAIPVAAVLGIMAGMGIGGGSLLILWLTIVVGTDTQTAATINLLFFIASAGIISLMRWRKGTLKIKKVLPGILAGCLTATLIGLLRGQIHEGLLEKLFGGLLLLIGLRELFYRDRKAK
jgi:uncharacterized membrane protein YfcA